MHITKVGKTRQIQFTSIIFVCHVNNVGWASHPRGSDLSLRLLYISAWPVRSACGACLRSELAAKCPFIGKISIDVTRSSPVFNDDRGIISLDKTLFCYTESGTGYVNSFIKFVYVIVSLCMKINVYGQCSKMCFQFLDRERKKERENDN